MKLRFKNEKTLNRFSILKELEHWYKQNPYAKRINENCICSDYRIDQQRPQRNVYSEYYFKIISISNMERRIVDSKIKSLEENIDYPTVWDDGENKYYEETIYCPKCGKRRKVLTSKTHCEFCGFEFSKAKKCPECNGLNLKGSDECRICGYEFRKKSFVKNDNFKVEKDTDIKIIKCPKCNTIKSKYFDHCQECGFDYSGKKECPNCHEWINENDKFCMYCGHRLLVKIKCENCGNENNSKNKYCNYCGNKL